MNWRLVNKSLQLLLLLGSLTAAPAWGLGPDELLLIVNKNVPDGRRLAELYAAERTVPQGRIVELDLPASEEISFNDYEMKVVPVLRDFIVQHGLSGKVRCLLSFYGVPLRIAPRVNTPADLEERRQLETEFAQWKEQMQNRLLDLERLAQRADSKFAPQQGSTIDLMSRRSDAAARRLMAYLAGITDPQAQETLSAVVSKAVDPLIGAAPLAERQLMALENARDKLNEVQQKQTEKLREQLNALARQFHVLQGRRADSESRARLRQLLKEQFSPFDYGRLLEGMIHYFDTDATDAALDSELALLWWNFYGRSKWLVNPLSYRVVAAGSVPVVLMTMRLDGPQAPLVEQIIAGCVKAQAEGLTGCVVIDSGGHLALDPKNPGYSGYDAKLRKLAVLVRTKTQLRMVYDENKEVLPPHSAKDVALYCGWYSVRRYIPTCEFVPGAIGYHTASFEMCSLRAPEETGWCKGLLSDGIAATLGPITEPFLQSFPEPDAFFPLLMTGKLTLAEVYWRTTPFVSWRMAMVGDPLYKPFEKNPPLKPDDLPKEMAGVLQPWPQTRPAPRVR